MRLFFSTRDATKKQEKQTNDRQYVYPVLLMCCSKSKKYRLDLGLGNHNEMILIDALFLITTKIRSGHSAWNNFDGRSKYFLSSSCCQLPLVIFTSWESQRRRRQRHSPNHLFRPSAGPNVCSRTPHDGLFREALPSQKQPFVLSRRCHSGAKKYHLL
jgi:hypothetical protein